MERYKILPEEGIEAIHENSLRIMKEIGIVMPYDHAKELLAANGCTVEGDLVKFPREVVEAAIESAPSSYMLHGRDEAKNVPISCERSAYAGPYGSPFVLDLDNGWRRSTMQDFINIVKIVDKCDYIDIQSHISCEPGDIEEKKRPLEMVYNTMRNSGKPLMASIYGYENAMRSIELASIPFGGLEAIKDKPIVASIPCTLTPLSYDPDQLGAIRAYAETGQVQLINSLSLLASSPFRTPKFSRVSSTRSSSTPVARLSTRLRARTATWLPACCPSVRPRTTSCPSSTAS